MLTGIAFQPAALTANPGEKLEEATTLMEAYVFHCNDGDTCRVKLADAIWFNIRLAGIDAPELARKRGNKPGQPFAAESRDWLNQQIKGKQVLLRQLDLDHYNRPIVEIFLQEKNMNLQILEAGLAEMYSGRIKRLNKEQYIQAEEKAKAAKKGIWSLKDYQSPSSFRKNSKK